MDTRETAAKVTTLIRLGETAEAAYRRALPKIADPVTVRHLARARADHEANAAALREVLAGLGEEEQPRSADFEWFVSRLVERVGRAQRRQEVLSSAREAEAAVLLQYADAADSRMPLAVGRVVRRHLARNEAHLDVIDALRGVGRRG